MDCFRIGFINIRDLQMSWDSNDKVLTDYQYLRKITPNFIIFTVIASFLSNLTVLLEGSVWFDSEMDY